MPEFFKPEPGLMIWTLASFIVFLVLMGKFAVGPIIDMLDKRRKTIEENIAKAEEARREAERLFAEYQAQLEQARQEARAIIEDGRKLAEKAKEEIIAVARAEAEAVREKALKAIELEREKALSEIKAVAADISIDLASRILKRTISREDNEALIREVLSEVQKHHEN